jgi:hypothetical protein
MHHFTYLLLLLFLPFSILQPRAQDANVATPLIIPEDEVATPLIIPDDAVATPLIIPTPSDDVEADPLEDVLGNANDYVAPIGESDSRYFKIQQSGEYGYRLDDDDALEITNINGAPTTIQVAVATATAAADGLEIGDIAVYLPAAAALSLRNSVVGGLRACGVLPTVQKRGAGSNISRRQLGLSECLIRTAHVAAPNDAVFGGAGLANYENLNLPLARGVAEGWARLLQTQIVGAIRNR